MFRRFSDRGAVTAGSVGTWYQTLHKPSFNPPDWIFGPVWMLLYTMMAIAAWRVWRAVGWSDGVEALSLFATQLALIAAAAFRKVDRPGRLADGALSRLGRLRRSPEFLDLAAQLGGRWRDRSA